MTDRPRLKNFPHQYNDLRKLRETVEMYRDMVAAGENVSDDVVFGYALAKHRIYTFRDREGFTPVDYTAPGPAVERALAARIQEEGRKPPAQQGARTAAREMRRTMRFLGWVGANGRVSPAAIALLAAPPHGPAELEAFQAALMSMALTDDAGTSHPVRILLKLVDEHGFASREGMELALAAADDSPEAYRAVSALAGLKPEQRRTALNCTETQMRNAVKILPSFAVQARLLARAGDNRFHVTADGYALLNEYGAHGVVAITPRPAANGGRRNPALRATADDLGRRNGAEDRRNLSEEEQRAAARLLLERTERHQELVRRLGALGGAAELYEDEASFDLVFAPVTGPVILWEVKTVDGDATAQVRRAAEQLPYYDRFHVREFWPGRPVLRAALFEEAPEDRLCAYLEEEHRIGAFTLDGEVLKALNGAAREVQEAVRRL